MVRCCATHPRTRGPPFAYRPVQTLLSLPLLSVTVVFEVNIACRITLPWPSYVMSEDEHREPDKRLFRLSEHGRVYGEQFARPSGSRARRSDPPVVFPLLSLTTLPPTSTVHLAPCVC